MCVAKTFVPLVCLYVRHNMGISACELVCVHSNAQPGSRGKALCVFPGVTPLALPETCPRPRQVLSSPVRLSHRRCCCEAMVSCTHFPPPWLCYCWHRPRGTQLETRGLAKAFVVPDSQGRRSHSPSQKIKHLKK